MVDYKVENSRDGMPKFIDYVKGLEPEREVEVEFPYRGEKLCLDIKTISNTLCFETGRMVRVSCENPRANPPIARIKTMIAERPEVETIEEFIVRQIEFEKRLVLN